MTNNQAAALSQVLNAVQEAIESAGKQGIPSGHLYAMMMEFGCTMETYTAIIEALLKAGKITESGCVLRGVKS